MKRVGVLHPKVYIYIYIFYAHYSVVVVVVVVVTDRINIWDLPASLYMRRSPPSSPLSLSLSILCEKRETKLLPGDVLTQHLICKVVLHVPTLLPSLVVSEKAEILFSLFFFFISRL
jgi:hypothetical protein